MGGASMPGKSLIVAENVGVRFPGAPPSLANVGFEIGGGEFVSLVGPSGCGKSTLLRLIAGLIEPTEGRMTIAGRPPVAARMEGRRVAFVFQEPRLLPWRTALDNVRLPLELAGEPAARRTEAARRTLELVGLGPADERKFPWMLSGGMRMRVSLARALVLEPEVLLLDEPFAALDDMLRQQLNEDLLRIRAAQGWTAVFVTHNVGEAVFLGQRVLVMSRAPGRIAESVPVPFDERRPELRADASFARLAGAVASRLREGA